MFWTWVAAVMKNHSIDFDVQEAAPHKWRWKIYPKIEDAPKIIGRELFVSRTSAIEACLTEIVRIEPAILALRHRSRASLRRPHLVSLLHVAPEPSPGRRRYFGPRTRVKDSLPVCELKWKLEAALKCRSCRTPRYSPPVHMIRLTKERSIAPYAWVHPDEDR